MDKRKINLNNLESFLAKAKNKLNEGIEDIGDKNMNFLEGFFSDIKKEKENFENRIINQNKNEENNIDDNKEIKFNKSILNSGFEFEVEYKKELFNDMINISDNIDAPFDTDFKSKSADLKKD